MGGGRSARRTLYLQPHMHNMYMFSPALRDALRYDVKPLVRVRIVRTPRAGAEKRTWNYGRNYSRVL